MFKTESKVPNYVWYCIMIFYLFIFTFQIISHNQVIFNLIYGNGKDAFMDFFNPISFVVGLNPYSWGHDACYSAVSFNLYAFIANVINVLPGSSGISIKSSVEGINALAAYTAITLALFSVLLLKMKKGGVAERYLFLILIIFSSPYIFQFERANIIFIANMLVVLFFICYRSKNKRIFEIGIISLAFASAIKIYPAIFGLLLIKDNNFRAAIRFFIYWLVLFFVPFFTLGGINLSKDFIGSLLLLTKYAAKTVKVNAVSVHNFILVSFDFLNNPAILASIVQKALIAAGLFSFFFHKVLWKQVTILSSLIILVQVWSMQYTAIFLTVPLILFLDYKEKKIKDIVYAVLFGGAFIVLAFNNGNFLTNSAMVETISILALYILLIFEGIYNFGIKLEQKCFRKCVNVEKY